MTVPQGCSEAVHRLWEYVGGGLDDADHRAVEAHLAWCLRCCGEVAFARELQRRLAAEPPSLPDDVQHRLEDFLDALEPTGGGGT